MFKNKSLDNRTFEDKGTNLNTGISDRKIKSARVVIGFSLREVSGYEHFLELSEHKTIGNNILELLCDANKLPDTFNTTLAKFIYQSK